MTDDEILERQKNIANDIVTKLNSVRKDTVVTRAVELLMKRIVSGGNTLFILGQLSSPCSEHDFALDGASILRGIYDAMLQALYILCDPPECEERARLYLDFYWVEWHEAVRLFDKSPTVLAAKVKNSPKRPQGEPAIQKEFEQVESKFLTKKGGLRQAWYPGTLRNLAKHVGLDTEYELFQRQLSGAVHSSPLSLKDGPIYTGFLLVDLSFRFSFRVLGRFAEYKDVGLEAFEKQMIQDSMRNIFDLGSSR